MTQGQFVWYELATTDPKAAASFYSAVVGWGAEEVPEMHYTILKAGEERAAGMMTLPEPLQQAGVPPHWVGYIGASDVSAAVARVKQAGGDERHPPTDIPGIGQFAVVSDPQSVVFSLFSGGGDPPPPAAPMRHGSVGWHELHTSDWKAALDFYAGQFGWTASTAMNMGPMGTYQIFSYGGRDQGGIMNAMDGMRPAWLFYFVVDGIDLAVRRVQDAGGIVVHGPQEVPGGAWIIQGRDPQGAMFALVSAGR